MIIRPEAEADLANAQGWYEWQREGLGADFLLCVEEVFERIRRMPELYPVVHRGVRQAITRRFPFSIYYLMESNEVVVLGVLHMRRNPKEWRSPV
jgi:plasmid stabilization system protein ParE